MQSFIASGAEESATITINYASRRNTIALSVGMLPLILIMVTSVAALANRIGQTQFIKQQGMISADAAKSQAAEACTLITGESAQVSDVHPATTYSVSDKREIREWETACHTESGNYSLRMDAYSGKVYGFNQVVPPLEQDQPQGIKKALLSVDQAEARAISYLRILQVDKAHLTLVHQSGAMDSQYDPLHTFNFHEFQPSVGVRTVTISINLRTGGLHDLWFPPTGLRQRSWKKAMPVE